MLPSASALLKQSSFNLSSVRAAGDDDGGAGKGGGATSLGSRAAALATHFFTFVLPRLAVALAAVVVLGMVAALSESNSLFESVLGVEMAILGLLLLCGLLGVDAVTSTVPPLASPVSLVLLESLIGAYGATWAEVRASRTTYGGLLAHPRVAQVAGAGLFGVALLHALLSALPARVNQCLRFVASSASGPGPGTQHRKPGTMV